MFFRYFLSALIVFAGFASLAQQNSPDLQEKLKAQWQLYRNAQTLLLQQVQRTDLAPEQRAIPRAQWEKALTPVPALTLSPQDILALKNSQDLRIQTAKLIDQKNSLIDLEQIRAHKSSKSFCEKIPKGGMLHIHPFGTLDRPLATQLLKNSNPSLQLQEILQGIDASQGNVSLYPQERKWLEQIPDKLPYLSLSIPDQNQLESFLFLPSGKQPFSRFNAVFYFLDIAISDSTTYGQVLLNFAQKAVNEGVIYVEFTTGADPGLFAYLAKLEKQTGLMIRANNAFNRTASLIEIDQSLSELLKQPASPYLVGIDFLDNEETSPALEKGQLLYGSVLQKNISGEISLHRTMHAGEIGDIRNPRDAMILGAERLGHGVNLEKDPVALEYAALIHEPIEINLSSNLRLTDVTAISQHPFLKYLRLGLPVSLSTDDEGIFEIDINHECEIAIDQTDINYAELKQMAFNSIQTSFATAADKKSLLEKLKHQFEDFEKNY